MDGKYPLDETDGYKWVGHRPVRPDGADKVTGRARYAADYSMPGQLWGAILRSPHPHARIRKIDTSRAEALKGVRAVITGKDFRGYDPEAEKLPTMLRYKLQNIMAQHKVLYEGHAVAAVAASDVKVANAALDLIEIDYECLPHVIDVEEAMRPDAPLLHEKMRTAGIKPRPETPSNISLRIERAQGDVEAGFGESDLVVERVFKTKPVHQGYIEPHACLANVAEDGKAELWLSTQGQHYARNNVAEMLGWDASNLRFINTEIGGGFGGKIDVYLEPIALLLSKKAHRPVKIAMTRAEVFRATGPTSGTSTTVKVGARKDGKILAAKIEYRYQAGAFPGSPVANAVRVGHTAYNIPHLDVVGIEVVSNRPSVAPYRAPAGPICVYAFENVMDEVAETLEIDPLDLRLMNAVKEGDTALHGLTFETIGLTEALTQAKNSAHYNAPLGPNQGRGISSCFWYNMGGATTVQCALNGDGTVSLTIGTPDIGGLRASVTQMAAEALGIDMDKINCVVGDTAQVGYSFVTGGSRTAYANGMATVRAMESIIDQACARAAERWDIPVEAVHYEAGMVRPSGPNAGTFEPLSLAQLSDQGNALNMPITASISTDAPGSGPSFGVNVVTTEVDPETGAVKIVEFSTFSECGRAIHPAYVEGQFEGGAAQGIGWALNEEYVYGEDGRLQNAGFLDYRMPVASDLPMMDTHLVEVPNPRHPFGVRGVGEISIVPSLGAISNAVQDATGVRFFELPMSPPKVLKALMDAKAAGDPNLKMHP